MQFTTKPSIAQLASIRVHFLVVLSVLVVAVTGCMSKDQAGWITCPPQVISVASRRPRRRRGHRRRPGSSHSRACWLSSLLHSSCVLLVRSLLLGGVWLLDGREGPAWVSALPWVLWLWQSMGLLWPGLRCQPEWRGVSWLLWQSQRLLTIGHLGLVLRALFQLHGEMAPRSLVVEGNEGGAGLWR